MMLKMKERVGLMYKIVRKESLNPTVTKMVIEAPMVAKKAKAGQFIIFVCMKKGNVFH